MKKSLIPIILAGGKGERFWPLSRRNHPKQFLSLDGSGKSLLQNTANRLLPSDGDWQKLWVITNAKIAEGVTKQLPQLQRENLLVEPEGKDTAPAVAWATLEVAKRYGNDSIIAFFPADHWIGDEAAFAQTLDAATQLAANEDAIVTLGITPNYPATGYGYIEQGELYGELEGLSAYKVNRFTEKPNETTAESFLQTGRYSWNSGMFVFRAQVVLQEFFKYAPEIIEPLRDKGKEAYYQLDKKSFDYALMEKTNLAYVLPANFGWDDLGDWNALERLIAKNGSNVELAKHVGLDTHGAIIYASDDNDVIVTIGMEDVVIVRDRHVTLVVNKNRTQDIKKVLKLLEGDRQLEELL